MASALAGIQTGHLAATQKCYYEPTYYHKGNYADVREWYRPLGKVKSQEIWASEVSLHETTKVLKSGREKRGNLSSSFMYLIKLGPLHDKKWYVLF